MPTEDGVCPYGDFYIAVQDVCQWCWCDGDGVTNCKPLEEYIDSVSTDADAIDLIISTLSTDLDCYIDLDDCEVKEWIFNYDDATDEIDCCPQCPTTSSPAMKTTPAPTTPAPTEDDSCSNVDYWVEQTDVSCQWCWCDADGTEYCDAVDVVAADADADTAAQMLAYFANEWKCDDLADFKDCDATEWEWDFDMSSTGEVDCCPSCPSEMSTTEDVEMSTTEDCVAGDVWVEALNGRCQWCRCTDADGDSCAPFGDEYVESVLDWFKTNCDDYAEALECESEEWVFDSSEDSTLSATLDDSEEECCPQCPETTTTTRDPLPTNVSASGMVRVDMVVMMTAVASLLTWWN